MSHTDTPRIFTHPDGRMDRKSAAVYLGCAPKTLADWATKGVGPAVREDWRTDHFTSHPTLISGSRTSLGIARREADREFATSAVSKSASDQLFRRRGRATPRRPQERGAAQRAHELPGHTCTAPAICGDRSLTLAKRTDALPRPGASGPESRRATGPRCQELLR